MIKENQRIGKVTGAKFEEHSITVIRTFECDLCTRFDSIMMPKEEIDKNNGIGVHVINHGNHVREVYYNNTGKFLYDKIKFSKKYGSEVAFKNILKNLVRDKQGERLVDAIYTFFEDLI